MVKIKPFAAYHQRYDQWFERHAVAYQSELLAVRALLPWRGLGLSIGVGTGRFAAPMGVQIGIDPAQEVLSYAASRGITTVRTAAETLPFTDNCFDYALSVTTICFVDDASTMLLEAYRVLKPGGQLVLGFIDRSTRLGQFYLSHQAENVFYRDAIFFTASEVEQLLKHTGFIEPTWVQTLTKPLDELKEIESLRSGYGHGAFVSVKAARPK